MNADVTPPLTADLCARAIIAAARVYGDDPARALMVKAGPYRRCLFAAAVGIAQAVGRRPALVAKALGLSSANLYRSRRLPRFNDAATAAERAARFACWRPEARASVLAGQSADEIELFRAPSAIAVARKTTRTITLGAARREVLASIRPEALTPPAIAERLNLPLAMVRQALDDLSEHREAVASALTAEGWKARFWKAV